MSYTTLISTSAKPGTSQSIIPIAVDTGVGVAGGVISDYGWQLLRPKLLGTPFEFLTKSFTTVGKVPLDYGDLLLYLAGIYGIAGSVLLKKPKYGLISASFVGGKALRDFGPVNGIPVPI